MNIQEIIRFLDSYLEENGLHSLSAVEAGQLLKDAGLLPDSVTRPGLPLRRLLRAGRIPHAYQTGGKGSTWVIPHSGQSIQNKKFTTGNKPIEMGNENTVQAEVKKISSIEQLRCQYFPDRIRVLFIGESPPAGGTFFYRGDSKLYQYTVAAFSIAYARRFLSSRDFLSFFCDQGCYLDDLCLIPVNNLSDHARDQKRNEYVGDLGIRIAQYKPEVIICVMKGIIGYVKDAVYRSGLKSIPFYSVPFPTMGNQQRYISELTSILSSLKAINR